MRDYNNQVRDIQTQIIVRFLLLLICPVATLAHELWWFMSMLPSGRQYRFARFEFWSVLCTWWHSRRFAFELSKDPQVLQGYRKFCTPKFSAMARGFHI